MVRPSRREEAQGASRHSADLGLARAVVERCPYALEEFGERLDCVPRFLFLLIGRQREHLGHLDVHDLAQEVVISAIRSLSSYQGNARLEVWLWRICRNQLLNDRRGVQRAPR